MIDPRRGEIWLVQLDPTRGMEIQKTRPALIISADVYAAIPLRIVRAYHYVAPALCILAVYDSALAIPDQRPDT